MLPIDLQALPAPAVDLPRFSPLPAPAASAVAAAADLLAAAIRPAIIAGRGAVLADARAAIELLADRTGALLATSAMAHGLFHGSPSALGIAGGFASPLAAELLAESDVIVSFGATLNHWTTKHGALVGRGSRLIQIDVDVSAIDAHQPADVGIVGDAFLTAEALLAELHGRDHQATGRRTPEIARSIATRRWRDEPYDDTPEPDTIDPRTLAIALDDLLPPDRAIAVDSGAFTGWPAMYMDVEDARSWVFCNAFQSVGIGLGAAIGAAVARPDRMTVAAVGDGGLFLALPELDAAARLALPLLIVVWNDSAYGAEVHHFGPMGHDVTIARYADSDFAAIARGANLPALAIRHLADAAALAAWASDPPAALLLNAKANNGIAGAWPAEAFRA